MYKRQSLTRAAQKLYLTQSTLSSRLDCLEKELGAPLLIRKKGIRRVELTEAGKKMVPVARIHMSQLSALSRNSLYTGPIR